MPAPSDPVDTVLELENFLPYQLNVCSSRVSEALSRIYGERYQIGVPEWRVLVTLGQFETMTAKAIGLHSHMHKTKVSRAVAMLERRKLIGRRANRADMREAFLSLTPAGREIYNDLAPSALEFARQLLDTIAPDDRAMFCRVMSKLNERADQIARNIAKEIGEDRAEDRINPVAKERFRG
ncbi:MAG: MarR family transcriptional regulator [Rhodopseudomonas sp.]|nr:MarR family transcriptional regulator [Rhodopseudomonas sp.]